MAQEPTDRPGPPLQRVLALSSMVVLVPISTLLGLFLHPRASEHLVYPVATCWVPPRANQIQSGADRRGDHLAVLGGDGQLHVYTSRHGEIRDDALPSPWPQAEPRRLRLAMSDVDRDDLLELLVVLLPARPRGGWPGLPEATDLPTAVYRQEGGRFVLSRFEQRPLSFPTAGEASSLFAGGQSYRLASAQLSNDATPCTQLVSDADHRIRHVLTGQPYQVADFDSDGEQDLLTIEYLSPDSPWCRYRLYLFRGSHFVQAWQQDFEQYDFGRLPRRNTRVVDLEGRGRPTIVAAEPARGKISFWRVATGPTS